nr:hypothetical protein CFP56_11185 [Quercus suber]
MLHAGFTDYGTMVSLQQGKKCDGMTTRVLRRLRLERGSADRPRRSCAKLKHRDAKPAPMSGGVMFIPVSSFWRVCRVEMPPDVRSQVQSPPVSPVRSRFIFSATGLPADYTPDEIVNRSAWDFFDADELPYARQFHQKRIFADKAAVLAYCRVRSKNGDWVGCEVCFSVTYDVMIVCTSIYRRGAQSISKLSQTIATKLVR